MRYFISLYALCFLAVAAIAQTTFIYGPGSGFSGVPGANSRVTSGLLGPCDIYGGAGTSCVAAHSTTRALFASYNGPLYQVTRASDSTTTNVGLLAAGGYVDARIQDAFCAATTCTITTIYDQTANANNLTVLTGRTGASATALQILISGFKAYGVLSSGTAGNYTHGGAGTGVATGSQGQGVYMVTSANNSGTGCCYDYGNAEATGTDNGNGHMNAIFFGHGCFWANCGLTGAGPWISADMENGWFWSDLGVDNNSFDTGVNFSYVTAMIKTNGTSTWWRKTANAQSGLLTTWFTGPLPTVSAGLNQPLHTCSGSCYTPLSLEGNVILGTGGDGSHASGGEFFEGALTFGQPSDAADAAVQANIVSVGYGT